MVRERNGEVKEKREKKVKVKTEVISIIFEVKN
jgi:hypothetical protein